RIAGFGAHVGAGQAVDRALRVVDGLVQRLHGAAVPAGGRAGAADRSAGSGLVRVVDVAGAVVHVHDVVERLAAADLHPSAVGTGEDRAAEGARRGLAAGDAGADAAAVARGHEAGGAALADGEADRAARGVVDEVGVAAADEVRLGRFGGGVDGDEVEVDARGLRQGGRGFGVGRLDDDPVGLDVHVVAVDAFGFHGVQCGRCRFELGEVVLDQDRGGALGLQVGGVGLGGGGDEDLLGVLGDPQARIRIAVRFGHFGEEVGGDGLDREPVVGVGGGDVERLGHLFDHGGADLAEQVGAGFFGLELERVGRGRARAEGEGEGGGEGTGGGDRKRALAFHLYMPFG